MGLMNETKIAKKSRYIVTLKMNFFVKKLIFLLIIVLASQVERRCRRLVVSAPACLYRLPVMSSNLGLGPPHSAV